MGIAGSMTEHTGEPQQPWRPTRYSERTRRTILALTGLLMLVLGVGLIAAAFPAWYALLGVLLLPTACYATRRWASRRPAIWRSPNAPPPNRRRELSQVFAFMCALWAVSYLAPRAPWLFLTFWTVTIGWVLGLLWASWHRPWEHLRPS